MVVIKISETINQTFLFIKLPNAKGQSRTLHKHITEVTKLKGICLKKIGLNVILFSVKNMKNVTNFLHMIYSAECQSLASTTLWAYEAGYIMISHHFFFFFEKINLIYSSVFTPHKVS